MTTFKVIFKESVDGNVFVIKNVIVVSYFSLISVYYSWF